MNNEQNKPIQAQELTEKELEGVCGGAVPTTEELRQRAEQYYKEVYERSRREVEEQIQRKMKQLGF